MAVVAAAAAGPDVRRSRDRRGRSGRRVEAAAVAAWARWWGCRGRRRWRGPGRGVPREAEVARGGVGVVPREAEALDVRARQRGRGSLRRLLGFAVGADFAGGLRHHQRRGLRMRWAAANCIAVSAVVASSARRSLVMMI